MPELAEDQIKEVIGSLAEYSESSVRAAIEAAKDPDVANQFAAYLDQSLEDMSHGDFTEVGLCIAISEARAITAIPALLRLAIASEWETGLYGDAAIYALQRMGMPAFEAAMRFIEQPLEDVTERIPAYSVLDAAMDADDATIAAVANFCLAQMPNEAQTRRDEDTNLAMFCCEALVALHDARVRPWLEEFAGDPEFTDLLETLDAGGTPDVELGWREPWPDQCADWAQDITAFLDSLPDEDGIQDEEIVDPEIIARVQQFREIINEFKSSVVSEQLRQSPIKADDLIQIYELGLEHIGKTFDFTNETQLHELLYDALIGHFTANSEYFARLPLLIEAFIEYLHLSNRLDDPEPLARMLEKASIDLPRLNDKPEKWGMEKTLMMRGWAAGFDMSTEEGVGQFVEHISKQIAGERLRSENSEPADPKPLRREAPKVGRNDPCPCGSGKKYKKCCGN